MFDLLIASFPKLTATLIIAAGITTLLMVAEIVKVETKVSLSVTTIASVVATALISIIWTISTLLVILSFITTN